MKEFLDKLADILQIDDPSPELDFRTVDWWDSLKGFSILVVLERDYGVRMTPAEFTECRTVADLARAAGITGRQAN